MSAPPNERTSCDVVSLMLCVASRVKFWFSVSEAVGPRPTHAELAVAIPAEDKANATHLVRERIMEDER